MLKAITHSQQINQSTKMLNITNESDFEIIETTLNSLQINKLTIRVVDSEDKTTKYPVDIESNSSSDEIKLKNDLLKADLRTQYLNLINTCFLAAYPFHFKCKEKDSKNLIPLLDHSLVDYVYIIGIEILSTAIFEHIFLGVDTVIYKNKFCKVPSSKGKKLFIYNFNFMILIYYTCYIYFIKAIGNEIFGKINQKNRNVRRPKKIAKTINVGNNTNNEDSEAEEHHQSKRPRTAVKHAIPFQEVNNKFMLN